MSASARVNWNGDAGNEVVEQVKEGKSYTAIVAFLYAKYGVSYTVARISQLVKQFRTEGRLPQKETNVVSN